MSQNKCGVDEDYEAMMADTGGKPVTGKPTEVQVREFWEWCGLRYGGYGNLYRWQAQSLPPINIDNLCEYAMPRVFGLGLFISLVVDKRFSRATVLSELGVKPKLVYVGENKDPALALFWALWQVKEAQSGEAAKT